MRGIQTTRGLSTGSRTIRGRLERGVRIRGGKRKRNDLYDKSSRESDSSNAEEEDSINQGSVTSDNSNLPGDNTSTDDKNPVNQGSDTIDNSNLADDNSSEGDENSGNSNDNWSSADLVLKVLQFNENERMKINVPVDDNPLFFFNLFVTDQLLNKLVTRSNTYAQVINSSRPLRRKSVLNTWKDVTATEMKQFLELVLHIKRTFQVSNDKRQIYINNAISKFW